MESKNIGNETSGASNAPLARYLALGDSYTIGESVHESARFPNQLIARLRDAGVQIADAEIIARTGWTTDELDTGINAAAPQGTYALVTLLIGVNNQYRGRAAENYRGEFRAILQRAIAFANQRADHVIVLSIPDWGVTPFGRGRANVSAEIDAYNRINRAESLRLGACYVDITPRSRDALHDATLIASDDLHPSEKMYAEWAELILPHALEILSWDLRMSFRTQ